MAVAWFEENGKADEAADRGSFITIFFPAGKAWGIGPGGQIPARSRPGNISRRGSIALAVRSRSPQLLLGQSCAARHVKHRYVSGIVYCAAACVALVWCNARMAARRGVARLPGPSKMQKQTGRLSTPYRLVGSMTNMLHRPSSYFATDVQRSM